MSKARMRHLYHNGVAALKAGELDSAKRYFETEATVSRSLTIEQGSKKFFHISRVADLPDLKPKNGRGVAVDISDTCGEYV
jgi:hypothetical protein